MEATALDASHAPEIVSVLCEAFYDYPVMRFVLGGGADYDRRLAALVGLVVASRVLRDEPMLGIRDRDGALAGVAVVSISSRTSPDALLATREQVWQELGEDSRRRYEAYGNASQPFLPAPHHHHLNMIGVRRATRAPGWAADCWRRYTRLPPRTGGPKESLSARRFPGMSSCTGTSGIS